MLQTNFIVVVVLLGVCSYAESRPGCITRGKKSLASDVIEHHSLGQFVAQSAKQELTRTRVNNKRQEKSGK